MVPTTTIIELKTGFAGRLRVYCPYCTDQSGQLQEFDERLEHMTQWVVAHQHAATRAAAEQRALDYMATVPAWRKHPKLLALVKPQT
jgi:hypothetical protein